MFLKDVYSVRAVNWGQTHMWDVKFTPPTEIAVVDARVIGPNKIKAPFDNWFPAIDIEEDLAAIGSSSFDIYNTTVKIGSKTEPKHIRMSFYDDVNGTLRKYFTDWMDFCSGALTEGRIPTIGSTKMILHIAKTGYKKDPGAEGEWGVAFLGNAATSIVNAVGGAVGGIIAPKKEEIDMSSYEVYPEDVLKYSGSSEPGLVQYAVNFVVINKIDEGGLISTGDTSGLVDRAFTALSKQFT